MSEVVGTAFVRIKALTNKLGKEIKDSVEKGTKDAKLSDLGENAGDEFVGGFDDSVSEGIPSSLEDAFDNDDSREAAREGGDDGGRNWLDGFRDNINANFGSTFRNIFGRDGNRSVDINTGGERDGDRYSAGFLRGLRNTFDGGGQFGILKNFLSGFTSGTKILAGDLIDFSENDRRIRERGDRQGGSFARSFVAGFARTISRFAGTIGGILSSIFLNRLGLIVAAISALVPLIINVVVGLVGQIGTLLNAALGGGLALIAGLSAGLLSILPLIAAFTIETPQLDDFKTEIKDLALNFIATAEIVQEQIFPPIIRLADFIANDLIVLIDEFAFQSGAAFASFVDGITDIISSVSGVDRINAILANSVAGFDAFLQALLPLFDAALTFFAAVSPLAVTFAEDLEILFTRLRDNLEARGLENLTEIFFGLYDTFILVAGGLADLGIALFNILSIGDSSIGQGFFERFREFAREFREFTVSDSGIERIREIFERAGPVLSAFAGLIGDIIREVFNASTTEEASGGLVGLLNFLRFEALPFLVDTFFPALGAVIGVIGDVLGPVISAFGPFVELLVKSLEPVGEVLSSFAEERGGQLADTFTTLTEGLSGPLTTLGPAFGEILASLLDVVLALNVAFTPVLVNAIVLFAEALAGLLSIPGVTEFIGAFAAFALVGVGIAKVAGSVSALFAAFATGGSLAPIVALLTGPVGIVAGIAALAFVIATNFGAIKDFFSSFIETVTDLDKIKEVFGNIGEAIGEAFAGLGEILTETVLPAIADFFVLLGETFVEFVGETPSLFGDLGTLLLEVFVDAVNGVISAIPGLLLLILEAFLILTVDIPLRLADLSVRLIEAFSNIVAAVGSWIALTGIPLLVDFWLELPGRIVGAIANLGQFLVDAFAAGIDFLINELPGIIQGVIDFYLNLPFTITNFITTEFGPGVVAAFSTFMDGVKSAVGERIDGIVAFFTGLPGRIRGFISDIGGAALEVGTSIINGIINGISGVANGIADAAAGIFGGITKLFNSLKAFLGEAIDDFLPNEIGGFEINLGPLGKRKTPSINLPDNPLKNAGFYANGGIVNSATLAIIGEAGAEVVIPLTNPGRAFDLANKSGLLDILANGRNTDARVSSAVRVGSQATTTQQASVGAPTFGPGSVIIYAQGTSATEVYNEFNMRTNWKMTTRGDA